MARPALSVVIPARNEAGRIGPTLSRIADRRTTDRSVEIVVVDDASTDGCCTDLELSDPAIDLVVERSEDRLGVPRARNRGARVAAGDVLFHTDAHVRFPDNWDRIALDALEYSAESGSLPDRIVTGTVADRDSDVTGYGCDLVVPFMGTHWNHDDVTAGDHVQIAPCVCTVLPADLFERIGGYDEGMLYYGGAEPEFSVRAWLSGAEISVYPALRVEHRFKDSEERDALVSDLRPFMIHNNVRFGLCYLDEQTALQMVRHYSQEFPGRAAEGFDLVADSDVWERKAELEESLDREFSWFVDRFDLHDQAGEPILGTRPTVPEQPISPDP